MQDKFKIWYHEWFDTTNGEWHLDPIHELNTENGKYYYNKQKLSKGGYLAQSNIAFGVEDLKNDGILPLRIDDENYNDTKGDIFCMSFSDKGNHLRSFENVWLPIPYFFKQTPKRLKFGPLNWSRMKLIPKGEEMGIRSYDVILAFDTRAKYEQDEYNEYPVFPDPFRKEMDFEICHNEFLLMDFCSIGKNWSYIDDYLRRLVHPNLSSIAQIRGTNVRRMGYIASYTFLINYLAQKGEFPTITLYKDSDVEVKDVDMVVDIGNSRTTALLIEDNTNFNQVRQLELVDYTQLIKEKDGKVELCKHREPFDMRLAFRKVSFGEFGIKDSQQFVYPSLIRLGQEANALIHLGTHRDDEVESLSTYSSPKRYLWDWRPNQEEWSFLVLEGEEDQHILNVRGITDQLKSDGTLSTMGGGTSYHYSRRALMTFSFLEMLVQARRQINAEDHRSSQVGLGKPSMPRKIRRIVITCPTTMSKVEREALVQCAKDAVYLLENFDKEDSDEFKKNDISIEVFPSTPSRTDDDTTWYYDEATCAQLVYMYGEVGHKYKGFCSEFFDLYGKVEDGDKQPSITVGSLDIGAGTADLMINKYTYNEGDITTITPDPKFFDSYYFAGDDMLHAITKNIMLLDEKSAFRKELHALPAKTYRQKIKDFFGKDHSGQPVSERTLRKDFNIQYSVPLMSYFLELLNKESKDCIVTYEDVFTECPPNESVIEGFKQKMGIDITTLKWEFDYNAVATLVQKEFEPLLKRVATIMYSYACDVILLSGRPASLPPIRNIFLKYYPVSPDRLIVLNNYYVGDWYPFSENTGYIKNAKTVVAMGGIIGHYASELSNLNKFVIDLDLLKKNLKSTVNYIATDGNTSEYLITPTKHRGDIRISNIPATLKVRQLEMDTYPCRALYAIDFNRHKMAEMIRKKAELNEGQRLTDAHVMGIVKDNIEALRKRMPFLVTLERDPDDKENVCISAISDKEGNEIKDSYLEIHIQSLGIDNQYWLDSGAFDF